MGFQVGDGRFHGFGALQHEGQLHLARTKQFPHNLHAIKQEGVDDLQGRIGVQGFIERCVQPQPLPIDDVLLQPCFYGQVGQGRPGGPGFLGTHPFKQGGELRQGVVGADRPWLVRLEASAVVDQIPADLLVLVADLDEGQDLGRADDCGIHAGLTAVMQEDGIQHNPCRRRESEAHIADTEHHMGPG